MASQSAPPLKAQAIYSLAQLFTESHFEDVLEVVLAASADNNLTVTVRNSQACAFLAQKSSEKRLVELILKYCRLGKEKTTANGIRALGYLNVEVTPELEQILIEGLQNRSAKITWNSCVAIAKFIKRPSSKLNSPKVVSLMFSILKEHLNLKSRI